MSAYFTRRMLSIHALAVAGIAVCLVAANWQWHRAHAARAGDVTVTAIDFQTASPLRAFMPSSSIGKTTSVSGEWIMDKQLLLSDRPADAHTWNGQAVSAPCAWVVRALRLADGSLPRVEGKLRGRTIIVSRKEPFQSYRS